MELRMYLNVASLVLLIKYCRGEIRCYCNDASCVNKGYMCKSSVDRCFSILTPDGVSAFRSLHGCAELLSGRLAIPCSQPEMEYIEYDTTGSSGVDQLRSRVVCCASDMCNYNADSAQGPAFPVPVASQHDAKTYSRISAMQAHKTSDRKTPGEWSENKPSVVHHQVHDVWFRAAVIAVPIAGIVILVLLVLLAVRMLRDDDVIKLSTNQRSPCIIKTSSVGRSIAIADNSGNVRTVLAPSVRHAHSKLTLANECERTKHWTDKDSRFKVEAAKRPKYEQFRPSSDCSESDVFDFSNDSHVISVTVFKNSTQLTV